jgi:acyl-homoserine lactone acylase PvdQ
MAPSDEVLVAYRLGQARSWEEFRRALRGWGAPALCFVYADRRGNIGVQPAGFLPRRDTTLPEWVWAFRCLDGTPGTAGRVWTR